jgi:hypothetical protein
MTVHRSNDCEPPAIDSLASVAYNSQDGFYRVLGTFHIMHTRRCDCAKLFHARYVPTVFGKRVLIQVTSHFGLPVLDGLPLISK